MKQLHELISNEVILPLNSLILKGESSESASVLKVRERLEFLLTFIFQASCIQPQFSNDLTLIQNCQKQTLIKVANNQLTSNQFKVDGVNFSYLLEKLSVQTLILTVSAILLERKIIVIHNDTS